MPTTTIEFEEHERLSLAYVAREELQTNRFPLAPQLDPLRRALAKLDPLGEPPPQPKRPKPRR